ncbi:MAG TPA: DUF2786 domain-containing protein [Candidatus Paceibacterota bacterium]
MSNFATDPMIEKIRKILKKAESAARIGNQEEADSANEMAAKLIAKYGVDQALLASKGEVQDVLSTLYIELTGNFVADKRTLLFSITEGLGAKSIFIKRRRPGTVQSYSYIAHIFAFESDLRRIEFLYDMLVNQMLVGAAVAKVPTYESARSYRKSWMYGFADAIRNRLQRNETKAAVEAGAGTDLVLFDRKTAVEARFEFAYPSKDRVSLTRRLSGSGRSDGYAEGQRANLGNNVGGSRRALVG